MKSISSFVAIAAVGVALGGCASEGYYAPRAQAAYYPASAYPATATTYYTPSGTTYYTAPATTAYYTYDPPSYQKSNVYASRSDYYRNYQGIHNGPERTGP